MDYLSSFFGIMHTVMSFLWSVVNQIFDYCSPVGLSFIFGLIVSFVVFRYLVAPYLR